MNGEFRRKAVSEELTNEERAHFAEIFGGDDLD